MHVSYFLVIRMFYCIVIVLMQKLIAFQILSIYIVANMQLWLVLFVKPFISRRMDGVEITNQTFTYIVTTMCFLFVEPLPSGKLRYAYGWAIILIVIFLIIINLAFQTFVIVKEFTQLLRRRKVQKMHL